MSSNLPDGITESHAYFNPPREIAAGVECGADEARVVPSYAVKAALNEIAFLLVEKQWTLERHRIAIAKVKELQEQIDELEQEREYECPFNDEIDLEESECARWDCPVCGNERETDTMPEERDPDEAWDRRGDDD